MLTVAQLASPAHILGKASRLKSDTLHQRRIAFVLAVTVTLAGLMRFDPSYSTVADRNQAVALDHSACPADRDCDRVGRTADLWRLASGFYRAAVLEPRQVDFARQQSLADFSCRGRDGTAARILSLHGLCVKLQV